MSHNSFSHTFLLFRCCPNIICTTMKLEELLPRAILCLPLRVDTWDRPDGYVCAVPKECPSHEWRMIGDELMMRIVSSKETYCTKCDDCETENCPYCFLAVNDDRNIRVIIRRCIVDQENKCSAP